MKDIKTQFDQFEVPVDEQGWESIAKDGSVIKYNKARRLHRWATISIPVAAIAIVAVITAVTLSKPKDVNTQTKTGEVVETATIATTQQQESAVVTHASQKPSLESQPVDNPTMPTSTTINVSNEVTDISIVEPNLALKHTPVIHVPAISNPSKTPQTGNSTISVPTPAASTQATYSQPISIPEQTIEQPIVSKSLNENSEDQTSNYNIYIPNSFTPNGDGKNDLFKAVADFPVKDYEMSIFSRSGDRVFTTRNIETGWDGQKYGAVMQEDIYIYIIKYTDPDGKMSTRKGQVLLLKQSR